MEEERKLQEIEIGGHIWLVDVNGHRLVDKQNPQNEIRAVDMRYSWEGYSFLYDTNKHCMVPSIIYAKEADYECAKLETLYVQIPHFNELTNETMGNWRSQGELDSSTLVDKPFIINPHSAIKLDDAIFFENATKGKMVIEIPTVEFMFRKIELTLELLKAKGLEQNIEIKYPGFTKKTEELIKEYNCAKKEVLESDGLKQQRTPRRKRKFGF